MNNNLNNYTENKSNNLKMKIFESCEVGLRTLRGSGGRAPPASRRPARSTRFDTAPGPEHVTHAVFIFAFIIFSELNIQWK